MAVRKKKGFQTDPIMNKNQVTSAGKPVTPPPPPWLELPEDITAKILHELGAFELLEIAQKVCTTWRRICKDSAMWRVIDMWNLDVLDTINYDLKRMCRHSVDRSQGQLVDIGIGHCVTDELLGYIAERSGQLRRLRLSCCCNVSGEGLRKAVEKLPLLEELHLQFCCIGKEDIEAVGQSCRMLKSFTLYGCGYIRGVAGSDVQALAVANSMPELQHLRMCGNRMTNDGLKAILYGCSKLKSLDLQQCFNLNLEGELGKKCAQQIKFLRLPSEHLVM